MHSTAFILFGSQHLIALLMSAAVIVAPVLLRHKPAPVLDTAASAIAAVIVFHMILQTFNTFTFNLAWQEAIPLHMCDLSAMSIAYYLVKRQRIFFIPAFFWGVGGASMALFQPDIEYAFPHPAFLPFFTSHVIILLGISFSCIALRERPYLSDVPKVIVISLGLMCAIYVFNFLLGENANFWYLNKKPAAASLMNFFPAAPFHILPIIPVAIGVFYLTYLPFWIRDKFTGQHKKTVRQDAF